MKRNKTAICRDVDGPRDCHTKWSQAERKQSVVHYEHTYVESRKEWYWWSYMQSRNGDTDIENKYICTKVGVGWIRRLGIDIDTLLILCVKWVTIFFSRPFYVFIFICSEFCHTLKWNSHGFTCVPHPSPPSHLPLHPLPLGFPSAPGPSACLMHPTWAGDLFHPRYYTCFRAVLLKHPTLSFSHRV